MRGRSVRVRLTLLYGALFFASGVALLAITYLLVRRETGPLVVATHNPNKLLPSSGTSATIPAIAEALRASAERQHDQQLHELLLQSAVALSVMTAVSLALGWFVAGRVLRPLRTMTSRTRQISERNLHERLALRGPADELKELADTIDGLLARLETAFDAQRRFVANASHELRTPLAMMRTSLDVAAAKPSPPSELLALDAKLREGLDQADRLLESFLALARAENLALARAASERGRVALRPPLDAALEARAVRLQAQNIEIDVQGDADVVGDAMLITRLVENLVDNAVRHNEPNGWISARIEAVDGLARLTVENGGHRLDDSEVQELVQPFRRLVADRTGPGDGFGLGLSIVAAIAAAHGGRLELRARSEGGLAATVELPLAVTSIPEERR